MVKAARRTRAVPEPPRRARYDELKGMLAQRQRELLEEMKEKIRDVRAEGSDWPRERPDPAEPDEVDAQDDIEWALIQMKGETLNRIDEALSRLEDGTYGRCHECGDDIAEARLRALPFAIRCKDCEEARETTQLRARARLHRGATPLGFDVRG